MGHNMRMLKNNIYTPPATTIAGTTNNPSNMQLAASWYVVCQSKELGRTKPKEIQLFGQDLVAWRTTEGKPVLMNRYCSHMGASLAIGKLTEAEGGCISCPFHGWTYDATGKCISIPYEEHIPKTAVQRTFPTVERYGYIWAWYGTPEPLFAVPDFPPAESESQHYMTLRYQFFARTTITQVLENLFDYQHLPRLHKLPAKTISMRLLEENSISKLPVKDKTAWFGAETQADIESYPGLAGFVAKKIGLELNRLTIRVDGWPSGHVVTTSIDGVERFKTFNNITPISEHQTIQHELFKVRRSGNIVQDLRDFVLFGLQTRFAAAQDLPVWNTMRTTGGGVYTKDDRGILEYRKFYQHWVQMSGGRD
jgi:phenylpropionate dioxygenase-like ring-hydroxylating dioxygenase large terminal subunit